MRKFLGNYVPVYAPSFKRRLFGLSPNLVKQIEETINDLRNDPYRNTEFLKGQYKGKRKVRLNDSDRLVFVICEECRHEGHIRYNRCSDCRQTSDKTLVIAYLILGHDYKGTTRW